MFVPFPWFIILPPLAPWYQAAQARRTDFEPIYRSPSRAVVKREPTPIPNVMPTEGNYGDYDYD